MFVSSKKGFKLTREVRKNRLGRFEERKKLKTQKGSISRKNQHHRYKIRKTTKTIYNT